MDKRLQKAVEERLQRLQRASTEGDVEALFSILAEDPLVLERIDEKAFLSTPLHTAVRKGKIQFAKEIVNLKPSFVCKRDHLGRSPLHLALEEKYQEMEGRGPFDLDLEGKYQELVTWLIQIDSELVRVKSKGMVTPLHYAAQINDYSNLADFLYVCPSSIQDLTVKCETVVHVAIKNGSCKALEVLLGCLRHFNKEEILRWEDEDGNNALHTAIAENQTEVLKLLIKYVEANTKNRQGLTALDIFYSRHNSLNAEVEKILLGSKAKRASEVAAHPWFISRLANLSGVKNSPVTYFSRKLPLAKCIRKTCGGGAQSINEVPLEVRNVLLVVAILITTTTYQAALSPSGGYWQDDGNLPANNTVINKNANITSILAGEEPSQQRAGHMIQGSYMHLYFLLFNSVAFFASVCSILILITGFPFSKFIISSTLLIVFSFTFAVIETFPYPYNSVVSFIFFSLMIVTLSVAIYCTYNFYVFELRRLKRCGRGKKLRLGRFENELKGSNIG
ncbi:hypothetical protein Patl1_19416 [Pistacia atlantica]|uniref:Uncharacterized protein n=1 Tax=Pistacia atlantica TaxID=434234 RepID=A0ACC1BZZ2_9ROSI|nr:hypothetical protein Patl1_19416 [Pistacia atlantica]